MNTKAVEPKTKLKIHVNKSLAIEPPELAGFYVDSVRPRPVSCSASTVVSRIAVFHQFYSARRLLCQN